MNRRHQTVNRSAHRESTAVEWNSIEEAHKPIVAIFDFANIHVRSESEAEMRTMMSSLLEKVGINLADSEEIRAEKGHFCMVVSDRVNVRKTWRAAFCEIVKPRTSAPPCIASKFTPRLVSAPAPANLPGDEPTPSSQGPAVAPRAYSNKMNRQITRFCVHLGCTHLFAHLLEADDVIATLVHEFVHKCRIVVFSNDRDFHSLLSLYRAHLRIFNLNGEERVDQDAAIYDVSKCIYGDCSKNIPNVLTGDVCRWPRQHPAHDVVRKIASQILRGESNFPNGLTVAVPTADGREVIRAVDTEQIHERFVKNQVLMDLCYLPRLVREYGMAQMFEFLPVRLQELVTARMRSFMRQIQAPCVADENIRVVFRHDVPLPLSIYPEVPSTYEPSGCT